jgi:hypothetical protein
VTFIKVYAEILFFLIVALAFTKVYAEILILVLLPVGSVNLRV